MFNVLQVDAEGLQSHAAVCDLVAEALSGTAAPAAAGHITQASAAAVAAGHGHVNAVASTLAARATSFGNTLRVASGAYVTTDEGGARSIAANVEA